MTVRKPNPLAILALALVLGWTSVAMAVTRLQAQAGMVVTLCTPTGLETVVLGEDGAPLSPSHPCPYCVTIAAAALPQDAGTPLRALPRPGAIRPTWPDAAVAGPVRACLPEARAPPTLSA